jgi:hypothetical protein
MRFPLHRSAAISLALAAMLLRALLPDGWMPSATASPFTICSVDVGHHDGKAPADQERSHTPCAFAAAAPLAPPAMTTFAFGISTEVARLPARFVDDRTYPEPHYRLNAARAPPTFA